MKPSPGEWSVINLRNCRASAWPVALGAWSDIEQREKQLRISRSSAVLLDPDGGCDPAITRFLSSPAFGGLADGTRASYLIDIRLFLTFLSRRGTDWKNACSNDLDDYEYWRRFDEDNLARVSGGRWNRGLAAIDKMYEWMFAHGEIRESPISKKLVSLFGGRTVHVPNARATDVRSSDVKWLTPRTYRLWLDVGMRGYRPSGERDAGWSGRLDDRNAAFVEFLSESGLRRREAGAQLIIELPDDDPSRLYPHAWVASAIAKRARRYYWVSRAALSMVRDYCATTRLDAIRRAQKLGRYDEVQHKLIVTVEGNGRMLTSLDGDRVVRLSVDRLSTEERLRLFLSTPHGLEPLALWLNEYGMPMPHETWNSVFTAANNRCRSLNLNVWCTPKMLRHSFALRMLVSCQYAFSSKLNLTENDRSYLKEIYGDVWSLVKDLLGHRSVETTKSIYLEPVDGLRLEAIFAAQQINDVTGLIRSVVRENGLVLDLTI